MTDTAYATRVRELNDAFRKTLTGGTVLLTQGVRELGRDHTRKALAAVKSFDRFEHGNDPHSDRSEGHRAGSHPHARLRVPTAILAEWRHISRAAGGTSGSPPVLHRLRRGGISRHGGQQRAHVELHGCRQPVQHIDARVEGLPLDAADIAAIDVRIEGQTFLGKLPFDPQAAQVPSQSSSPIHEWTRPPWGVA